MEEMNRRELILKPQLEDFPELIHNIQSLLAANEAARTCVLSKSWLHAWSTIPTLRFTKPLHKYPNNVTEEETTYNNLIDNTLLRYHRDNIPIESLDIHFVFRDDKSALLVEKWIMCVASKSSLKELSLTLVVDSISFSLINGIFYGKNLNKLRVHCLPGMNYLRINTDVIKCVSLRVLELLNVHICEEVLHNLLSTCILLEKINLSVFYWSKTVRVKNLRFLEELRISLRPPPLDSLEDDKVQIDKFQVNEVQVDEVPSLQSIVINVKYTWEPTTLINMGSLGSVTELSLSGVIVDDALLDMIKSKFIFLESLTLDQILDTHYCLASMNITCLSLKRLTIRYIDDYVYTREINLQIYAPKLIHFNYTGFIIPLLVFPTVTPERIKVTLDSRRPVDYSFFLKLNEMLNLSTTFDIEIVLMRVLSGLMVSSDFDIDLLRTSVPFRNMNVQRLLFSAYSDSTYSSGLLHLFEAFFSVCHPSYVTVCEPIIEASKNESVTNHLVNVVMEEIIKKGYWSKLKVVEIKNFNTAKGENNCIRDLANFFDLSYVELKLNW